MIFIYPESSNCVVILTSSNVIRASVQVAATTPGIHDGAYTTAAWYALVEVIDTTPSPTTLYFILLPDTINEP